MRTLAAIEPEGHFFEVGGKMLRANTVPRSHDPAFEERKRRFNSIGVNISHDVNLATVIDGLVFFDGHSCPFHGEWIGLKVIRHNHVYILADVLTDELRERSSFDVRRMEHAKVAIALADANDNFLVISTGM